MTREYLVWSNEHRAWWGPGMRGYVARIENAGRYSHEQAMQICTDAMPGRLGSEPLHEVPVALEDLRAMLGSFNGIYPGHDPEPQE